MRRLAGEDSCGRRVGVCRRIREASDCENPWDDPDDACFGENRGHWNWLQTANERRLLEASQRGRSSAGSKRPGFRREKSQ